MARDETIPLTGAAFLVSTGQILIVISEIHIVSWNGIVPTAMNDIINITMYYARKNHA